MVAIVTLLLLYCYSQALIPPPPPSGILGHHELADDVEEREHVVLPHVSVTVRAATSKIRRRVVWKFSVVKPDRRPWLGRKTRQTRDRASFALAPLCNDRAAVLAAKRQSRDCCSVKSRPPNPAVLVKYVAGAADDPVHAGAH